MKIKLDLGAFLPVRAHLGMEITAEDVAVMMALLKIARIGTGTATDDSWVDLAGYAACGGEIAAKGRKHG